MHTVKILDIKSITQDVKSFTVEKPEGYNFTPGQATEVAINKPDWQVKKHAFTFTSLCSDPNLEFTIKGYPVSQYPNHSGMTEQLHKLEIGDELLLDDPWGTIEYKGTGVFLAAGAGITPFIAIFRDLDNKNKLENNKLIFSNKTAGDIILKDEFKKIFPQNNFINTLTQENNDKYEYGRIDEEFIKKHINNFSQNYYICGPKAFVTSIKVILENLGANTESLVFEK